MPERTNSSVDEPNANEVHKEKWYGTVIQILIPFCLASLGTITAGVMLGHVGDWTVYKEMDELIMLVPGLCGLKGNLDMCVAARLCTQAAMGNLRQCADIRSVVIGNLAVVQVQAIICSLVLVSVTSIIHYIVANKFIWQNFATLSAASLITASVACMLLDTMLLLIILFSQRYRFNPDYFATPIVASIGDATSIGMLSFTAAFLYDLSKRNEWLSVLIVCSYVLVILPIWAVVALRNVHIRPVLFYGWIPVFGALFISEVCGYVLGVSAGEFNGFTLFSPVINGSGGNLVSIQANSMSSLLHQRAVLGKLPEGTRICESPQHALCYGSEYSRIARIVIAISIPCNILQAYLVDYFYALHITVHVVFVVGFCVASLLQLIILLWTAHVLVHGLWRLKIDPDSSAIPYLTAFGDTLGTSLLAIMFLIVENTKFEYLQNKSFLIKD